MCTQNKSILMQQRSNQPAGCSTGVGMIGTGPTTENGQNHSLVGDDPLSTASKERL